MRASGGCVQGSRLGRPLCPLPLSPTGLDRRRLWLVTELPPVQGGRHACEVPFRQRGCWGSSPSRQGPPTFHKSFGCAFVCMRAHGSTARCKVHSQGCTEGRRGSPCIFADPCACVIVWSAPGLSPPAACRHPRTFANLQGICFLPSLKIWPAFPTGRAIKKLEQSSPPIPGENKKLGIDQSCLSSLTPATPAGSLWVGSEEAVVLSLGE